MLHIIPGPSNRVDEISLGDLLPARKVSRGNLGIDLDLGIGREEVLCNIPL
jgi:hypothetical protein